MDRRSQRAPPLPGSGEIYHFQKKKEHVQPHLRGGTAPPAKRSFRREVGGRERPTVGQHL